MTEQLEEQLRKLVSVFLSENQKLNLSAFRTEENCWAGNVLDSIAFLALWAETRIQKPKANILDIGTGGGFPLLPLAILLPECSFVGLDATKKKVDAVDRIIAHMKIENASTVSGRAEELGRDPQYREQFDIVTSRAVAPLNVLLEYCAPFATIGGHVVIWKSLNIDQELQDSLLARAELSCHLVKTHEYELPGDWGKRQLLVFEKTTKTHEKYPRKTGVPKKEPLQ